MDPDSSTIYPALTAFLLLLVLSGLFSAAEAAFTGINDSQTQRRAAEGDKKARHIMDLIRKPTVFISTVRTGSTLCAMLGLTVLSPSLTGLFLERFYQEMEVPLTAYPVFLILITILVGIVTIALGNILPGRLGDFFPDQTASLLTPFMMVMSILLRPIVWLTLGIANLGLRLLGQNPNQEPDTVTEEEIRMMVTVGEEKGAIEQSEKDMINNIFEFDDRVVTEVMTHRMEMIALKDTVQLDEAVKVARETRVIPGSCLSMRTLMTLWVSSMPRICCSLSTTAATVRILISRSCCMSPSISRKPPSVPSCSRTSSASSCTWRLSSMNTAAPMAW